MSIGDGPDTLTKTSLVCRRSGCTIDSSTGVDHRLSVDGDRDGPRDDIREGQAAFKRAVSATRLLDDRILYTISVSMGNIRLNCTIITYRRLKYFSVEFTECYNRKFKIVDLFRVVRYAEHRLRKWVFYFNIIVKPKK
jgi:hypothetical protein